METTIEILSAGAVAELPVGSASGIYKSAVDERLWLGQNGARGDSKADHDNHAGPERALHQYPAEHYEYWSEALDDAGLVPGTFGENISTRGMT